MTTIQNGTLEVTGTGTLGTGGTYDKSIVIGTTSGVAGTSKLIFSQDADQTLSGVISGRGSLTKDGGNGTLTLSGNNSYTGDTTVKSGGTLEITGTGTLGNGNYAGKINIENAAKVATLTFNQNVNQTLLGVIEGNGVLAKSGTGTLTLTADNSFTGRIEVSAGGTLEVTGTLGNGTSGNNHNGDIDNSGTLIFDQIENQTLSGEISGSGTLKKDGDGTLTLSNFDSTYDGNIDVNKGTLEVTGVLGKTAGGNDYTGNIQNDAVLIFKQGDNQTLSGDISGNGGLTKDGAATLTLSGNNSYKGLTEVKNGTLALSGSGKISDRLALYKDTIFNAGTWAGTLSQLDVHGNATYTGDLNTNGGTMNFYVPTTMGDGDIMLTVNGTANVNGSTVNVGVSIDGGTSPLQVGEQIVLINATTLNGAPTNGNGSGMQGVSLEYEFDITTTPNQLLATVRDITPNEQTKAFSEARLSQLAFTNQGSDLIAGQGLSAALDATANRTERRTTTFGAISGGSSRYKTGSHSDVTGVSLITGLAGSSRLALGKLTLGAFFEYGNANYDSHNSFTNAASVRGNGKTDYTGGGVLAHFEFNSTARGNAWLESSARFGRATVDFQTNDMTGNLGKRTAFDSDSNYAAAHIGLGYHWKLTKQNGFDLYAQYLWSRQNADTAELTTNETVKFETANSERLRLGSRFVYNLNPHRRAYAGIAWEHEFDSEANASIFGYRLLDTPKLTGDTCKLELGLTLQPTKTCPITRNFGIQGYTGKREGIAGSVEVRYEF